MNLFKRFSKDRSAKTGTDQQYRDQAYQESYENFPENPDVSENSADDYGQLNDFRDASSNSYSQPSDWTEEEAWQSDWHGDQASRNDYDSYGKISDEAGFDAFDDDQGQIQEEFQIGLESRTYRSDQTTDLGHRAKYSAKVDSFLNNGIIIMGILLLAVLLIAFLV